MDQENCMNPAYIFDVDGTLTPSRCQIVNKMKSLLEVFSKFHDIYLVSGSDYAKTVEQLGKHITENIVKKSYNCSGNSIWENGTEIFRSPWRLPDSCELWMKKKLAESDYCEKTGNHIEHRIGAVNFSIVGRNANHAQRDRYKIHDSLTNERILLAQEFNSLFSDLDVVATVGGETGIDITQKGKDKSQVLDHFARRPVIFFGDRCDPGGNDYPIARAILDRNNIYDKVYNVKSWEDTYEILHKNLTEKL